MKKKEILDEQLTNSTSDERTQNFVQKAALYLAIMLLVNSGLVYFEYRDLLQGQGLFFYATGVTVGIIFCVILSSILELFRFIVRKSKSKQSDTATLVDPIWFQIIEGAFALWILFTVIKVILLLIA